MIYEAYERFYSLFSLKTESEEEAKYVPDESYDPQESFELEEAIEQSEVTEEEPSDTLCLKQVPDYFFVTSILTMPKILYDL